MGPVVGDGRPATGARCPSPPTPMLCYARYWRAVWCSPILLHFFHSISGTGLASRHEYKFEAFLSIEPLVSSANSVFRQGKHKRYPPPVLCTQTRSDLAYAIGLRHCYALFLYCPGPLLLGYHMMLPALGTDVGYATRA
eukprot:700355-Rhodomonas_salina.3